MTDISKAFTDISLNVVPFLQGLDCVSSVQFVGRSNDFDLSSSTCDERCHFFSFSIPREIEIRSFTDHTCTHPNTYNRPESSVGGGAQNVGNYSLPVQITR